MKVYSDSTKWALYKNVYILFESILVYLINHIKDEVSLIHHLWKGLYAYFCIKIEKNKKQE